MTRVHAGAAIAVALTTVAACLPLPDIYDTPPPSPIAYGRATERQVARALERYSGRIAAMDADGVAAIYAPDGVWERQSGRLYGREAIRAAILSTGGLRVLSNEMVMHHMSYNGPELVQVGEFRQVLQLANGKTANVDGRFEATWVQVPAGDLYLKRMVTRAGK